MVYTLQVITSREHLEWGNHKDSRRALLGAIKRHKTINTDFYRDMGRAGRTVWRPETVFHPESGMTLTRRGAIHMTQDVLEEGWPMFEKDLDGTPAFEMLIPLEKNPAPLYIKLHKYKGSGIPRGRSFHASDYR